MAAATASVPTTTSKPQLSALKTCASSSTYPSELRSPYPDSGATITPTTIKTEQDVDTKTPMTPPVAYVDFLKALSPALSSPATTPSSALSRHFTFTGLGISDKAGGAAPPYSAGLASSRPAMFAAPTSVPSSSTSSSFSVASDNSSNTSISSAGYNSHSNSFPGCNNKSQHKSPFTRPHSARTPSWRLHIPQSPYSPAIGTRSPLSARGSSMSVPSPARMQPKSQSQTPLQESDADTDGNAKHAGPFAPPPKPTAVATSAPHSAGGASAGPAGTGATPTRTSVSVTRVVTRKVTFSRTTPIEPAPKGKRRKVEDEAN